MVAEDSIRKTVHARLTAAGAEMSKVAVIEDPVTIPDEDDLAVIEQTIIQVGARLLVIDPLMAFLVRYAGMEQAVRDALNKIKAMAERTNTAVVAVRHLSKNGGKNSLYRGMGSIGIIAVSRSGLLLAKDPEDKNLRVLCQHKNNLGPLAPSLLFEPMSSDNGSVCIEWRGSCDYEAADLLKGGKHGEKRLNEAMQLLSELLAKGPVAVNDIRAKAITQGLALRTLERAKEILGLRSDREGWGPGSKCFWSLPSHDVAEKEPPGNDANQQNSTPLDDNDEYF
jgi:hypothetical protein